MYEKRSKETQKVIKILQEQLESYGAFTILAALEEIGLLGPQEPSEDKPLTDTDRVEYLPADAWSDPKPENGCTKRTVKQGKHGRVKITHADGSTQMHPRTARPDRNEGYPQGMDIYRCSGYIPFPAWPKAPDQVPQQF